MKEKMTETFNWSKENEEEKQETIRGEDEREIRVNV